MNPRHEPQTIVFTVYGRSLLFGSACFGSIFQRRHQRPDAGFRNPECYVGAAVAPHWSVEPALLANPVSTERLGLTAAALQPGVRYWFFEEYAGHFLAMHAALASYNVWNASHRHKGWLSGAGISYGYCWPLSARWNMTLEGGIGIYHMRESEKRRFTPDSEPEYIRHHRRWVFGPSKCALTFSYLF